VAERNPGQGREDGREDGRDPVDEDAAWAAIVAAYGEEPADPDRSSHEDKGEGKGEDKDRGEDSDRGDQAEDKDDHRGDGDKGGDDGGDEGRDKPGLWKDRPLGSSVTVLSAGAGPRDWSPTEPSEGDFDETDEGHFVPPEPPPLPQGDTTAKFAWLAVLGGPLLLLLTVLLQWDMTWWIATLGIGGFLGGFATLVARMNDGDDEDDDPGRGAVV
jgi:hypothetical protein